jgi:UTP--glucose-1-phosphate uridylyltransferase
VLELQGPPPVHAPSIFSAKGRPMNRIRRAVFPAAGLGTRFLPATKAQPKEMLPLVDKPIIQYAVEEAVASGLEDLVIVTGRGKNAIEDHFDVSFELERLLEERGKPELLRIVRSVSEMVHVAYVRQKEALGLGHAILMARSFVEREPFAVLLGDDIIESAVPCTRQMMDVHARHGTSVIAIMEVPDEEVTRYGIIRATPLPGGDGRVFAVEDMVEKPSRAEAPSNLAIIGRYILTPGIFDLLAETGRGSGGEIQLTDGLRRLLAREKIVAYRFEGKRHDAGDKLGFLKATVEFALRNDELGPEFREYLRSLDLGGAAGSDASVGGRFRRQGARARLEAAAKRARPRSVVRPGQRRH